MIKYVIQPLSTVLIIILITCTSTNSREKISSSPICYLGNSYNWATSAPEEQGMDSSSLNKAYKEIKKMPYINSFLIVKNGFLVVEKYYNGRDSNTLDLTYSVTKSVISALIGIAIRDGYIDSLDQKMLDFFPHYNRLFMDERKESITIRHILSMQSGFDKEENISKQVYFGQNEVTSIISSKLAFSPQTNFLYSTHGSHLLSAIITKATGVGTLAFAQASLFSKIGVYSVAWAKDKNGINCGGAGIFLTPRDMARFGYLYLRKGFIDGKQIVPAYWVEKSIQNCRGYITPWKEMDDVGYGYHWWTGRFNKYSVYFASGYGGQWILNIPDLDMIIVTTMNADTEKDWNQMESLIPIISNFIIPSVK